MSRAILTTWWTDKRRNVHLVEKRHTNKFTECRWRGEGRDLSDVTRALGVFGSHSGAERAGDRKGPAGDGEDGTVAQKGRQFVCFQGGGHDHHFERDGAPPGALVWVKEELLQEAQEDVLQKGSVPLINAAIT